MRRSTTRAAAGALTIALALGSAVPCMAAGDDSQSTAKKAGSPTLTRLSPASRRLLAPSAKAAQQQPPESSPSSFFHSKRGAVTLALMGAGVGFTLWSIQHDRKPVKSPVR